MGAKGVILSSSLSSGGAIYSRALKTEVIIPTLPLRWGEALNTNDWCIMTKTKLKKMLM